MRRSLQFSAALVVTLAFASAAVAQDRWDSQVAALEAAARVTPHQKGEVLFIGSSTIHRWDVASSFPDLRTINQGIDGTELADAVKYTERLILPFEPRVVVVYAGDNDIAGGKTSEEVAIQFERLTARILNRLPQSRIVFIGLKPSIQRWAQVDRMRAANDLIRGICAKDDRIAYVDVDGPMLGWDERPRRELFVEDGLHLSAEGYRLWTALLRPFVAAPPVSTTANVAR
jgi:lysophospholipase L1-like esterase